MAVEMWVTVANKWCELAETDVALEERRAFPTSRNNDMECYLVLGRRCTTGIFCNLAGIQCRWAYSNPNVDRFKMTD